MKDVSAGLLCIGIAGFFLINALLNLKMGTAFRMGPAYFPVMLSAILMTLGAAITLRGFMVREPLSGAMSWRALGLIALAPVLFGIAIRTLGLAPAMFLTVSVCSFASRKMTPMLAIILGLALALFCSLVFKFGLGLPLKLFEFDVSL
jgi:hypothetical protein